MCDHPKMGKIEERTGKQQQIFARIWYNNNNINNEMLFTPLENKSNLLLIS